MECYQILPCLPRKFDEGDDRLSEDATGEEVRFLNVKTIIT